MTNGQVTWREGRCYRAEERELTPAEVATHYLDALSAAERAEVLGRYAVQCGLSIVFKDTGAWLVMNGYNGKTAMLHLDRCQRGPIVDSVIESFRGKPDRHRATPPVREGWRRFRAREGAEKVVEDGHYFIPGYTEMIGPDGEGAYIDTSGETVRLSDRGATANRAALLKLVARGDWYEIDAAGEPLVRDGVVWRGTERNHIRDIPSDSRWFVRSGTVNTTSYFGPQSYSRCYPTPADLAAAVARGELAPTDETMPEA